MEPSSNTPRPGNHGQTVEQPSVSSRPKAKTHRLALLLIILVLSAGIVTWIVFPLFFKQDEKHRGHHLPVEDPRQSYKGPLQNIHPDVRYVGTKVCVKCHAGLAEIYSQTPMGRSLIPMATLAGALGYDQAHNNPFKAFDSLLRIERLGDQVWHSQSKVDEKGQPIYQNKLPVHYALGSGNHGHSFVSIQGESYLFQTPISWFKKKQQLGEKQEFWDASPGFVEFYRRSIIPECMYCHVDRAIPRENYVNRYQMPSGSWHAIGCERCHGPGEKHVENPGLKELNDVAGVFKNKVTKADVTIVNPGKLLPELAEAVCQQCHLEGEVRVIRRGRGLYDFRPGLPLGLFWSVFVDGRESGEDKKAVNHAEQMVLSRCFQRSQGDNKLGCITCHDPHHVPVKESQRLDHFREKCWKCHAPGDKSEAGKLPCSLPLGKRQLDNQDNCLACHMRPYGTSDIAHAASTDHRILRLPEEKNPHHTQPNGEFTLAHFHLGKIDLKDKEMARDLGIALSRFAIKKDPRRLSQAIDLLENALQYYPDDLKAWEQKGSALLHQMRFSEALAAFEFVLAKNPGKESALATAAWIYQKLGEANPALQYWKKAVALNPWMAEYQANVTKLLLHQGAWDEIGPSCRQWLHLSPGNSEARKTWIEYLIRTGKGAEAKAEFSRLQALRPVDPDSLNAWFAEISNRKSRK